MLLVSTPTVPNKTIESVHGIARGSTVRARNVGQDIFAGLKNIIEEILVNAYDNKNRVDQKIKQKVKGYKNFSLVTCIKVNVNLALILTTDCVFNPTESEFSRLIFNFIVKVDLIRTCNNIFFCMRKPITLLP